jgi:predicted Zn finger-like uncharacterized protein
MKIVCPSCNALYRVPDAKISAHRTLRATCKKCGRVIRIDPADHLRLSAADSSPSPETGLDLSAGFSLGEVQEIQEFEADRIFSNLDCIRFGWQAVKREPVLTIVGMVVVPFAIQAAAEVLEESLPPEAGIASAVVALLAAILEMVVTLGLAVIGLRLTDGETTTLKDLHAHYRRVPAYLIASLLTGLLCLVGFALLILPGVLFSVWFSFYALVIVDDVVGPIQAMKRSYALARGNFWRIAGFWGWVFGLNLLGLVPCGLGLLITLPVTFVAWACLYRVLQGRVPVRTGSTIGRA